MFSWKVVKTNAQNTNYLVSTYNTLTDQQTNIKQFNSLTVQNGSYNSAQSAIKIANNIPVVKQFKWNSYYTIVDAKYNSTKWNITYYDILNSYTGNNLTVSVP